jgi:hypothetical protein
MVTGLHTLFFQDRCGFGLELRSEGTIDASEDANSRYSQISFLGGSHEFEHFCSSEKPPDARCGLFIPISRIISIRTDRGL